MKPKRFSRPVVIFGAVVASVLAGLVCWWAIQSHRERRAVEEATSAVEYYLPRLAAHPTLGKEVGSSPWDGESRAFHFAKLRRKLTAVAGLKLRSLAGKGYAPPGMWNIQGHHYLQASRDAVFAGGATIPLVIYVMHPKSYVLQIGDGLEVTNDPKDTGLDAVGQLKFVDDNDPFIRVFVSHAGVAP